MDIGRLPRRKGGGIPALTRLLEDESAEQRPFAPPYLKAGKLVIGQTANILMFLGPRLGLVPRDEARRLWAHQLQLTIADLVAEVHETHHPIASSLYYEEQKREARRRAAHFRKERAPKFLGYFEHTLAGNRGRNGYLVGRAVSYVDLSMFQTIAGLCYAFPKAMTRLAPGYPRLMALCETVAARPNMAAYLTSERRIPFNESGIFRQYPELDG